MISESNTLVVFGDGAADLVENISKTALLGGFKTLSVAYRFQSIMVKMAHDLEIVERKILEEEDSSKGMEG